MLKYSIKRIILAFITTFIILTLTFFLVKSLPPTKVFSSNENVRFAFYTDQLNLGYVIQSDVLRPDLASKPLDSIQIIEDNTAKTVYFYTRPIVEQYFNWLKNIVTKWDWGRSTVIEPNASAINIIGQRLPVSMSINVWADRKSVV